MKTNCGARIKRCTPRISSKCKASRKATPWFRRRWISKASRGHFSSSRSRLFTITARFLSRSCIKRRSFIWIRKKLKWSKWANWPSILPNLTLIRSTTICLSARLTSSKLLWIRRCEMLRISWRTHRHQLRRRAITMKGRWHRRESLPRLGG